MMLPLTHRHWQSDRKIALALGARFSFNRAADPLPLTC
jgi:hypothetical protein